MKLKKNARRLQQQGGTNQNQNSNNYTRLQQNLDRLNIIQTKNEFHYTFLIQTKYEIKLYLNNNES